MSRSPRRCEFAFPGPLRDRLTTAVLSGEKTATSCLLAEYEVDREPLPQPGEVQLVIDSAGAAIAAIEITAVSDASRLSSARDRRRPDRPRPTRPRRGRRER